jgi:phosphoglucosamine mutase
MRFGTDGLRGEGNVELTPDVAMALGRASALVIPADDWLVGWDTRLSSTMLVAAFAAGVASAGRDITLLGVVPTSGLAFSCWRHGRPGAMVTASHNPFHDNGIKVFGPNGEKLPDAVEQTIEAEMHHFLDGTSNHEPQRRTGVIEWSPPPGLREEYPQWLADRARAIDARALRIGVDCANGAAFAVAPPVVAATGATIRVIGDQPDGVNINEGLGSTDLSALAALVVDEGLDFGLAFDGDADRLLAVDERGQPLDGDFIISILALDRAQRGTLVPAGVVVTEWSNLGLHNGLRQHGLTVEICDVGDKAVAVAMEKTGYLIGGEQSGHVILRDLLPVGDGVSTAVEFVAAVVAARIPLSQLAARSMRKLPQGTRNVRVARAPKSIVEELDAERQAVNDGLGGRGRLVLRPSGTEPVVRIMAEADDEAHVAELIERFAALVLTASARSST